MENVGKTEISIFYWGRVWFVPLFPQFAPSYRLGPFPVCGRSQCKQHGPTNQPTTAVMLQRRPRLVVIEQLRRITQKMINKIEYKWNTPVTL